MLAFLFSVFASALGVVGGTIRGNDEGVLGRSVPVDDWRLAVVTLTELPAGFGVPGKGGTNSDPFALYLVDIWSPMLAIFLNRRSPAAVSPLAHFALAEGIRKPEAAIGKGDRRPFAPSVTDGEGLGCDSSAEARVPLLRPAVAAKPGLTSLLGVRNPDTSGCVVGSDLFAILFSSCSKPAVDVAAPLDEATSFDLTSS